MKQTCLRVPKCRLSEPRSLKRSMKDLTDQVAAQGLDAEVKPTSASAAAISVPISSSTRKRFGMPE